MRAFVVSGYVTDDPAYCAFSAVVVAPTIKEARTLGKQAAIDAYNAKAGGWSHDPKISGQTYVEPVRLDDAHVVMASVTDARWA